MARARDIRRRIRSVENTREITHTMELVSSSKLRRAQERVSNGRPYIQGLNELGEGFLGQAGTGTSPLGEIRETVRAEGILLLTSNRGLCGAFNNNLILETKRIYADVQSRGRTPVLYLVGKKGLSHFRYLNYPIESSWTELGDRPTLESSVLLADRMARDFTAGRMDFLHLVYCRFESAGRHVPTVTALLPVRSPETSHGFGFAADGTLAPWPEAEFGMDTAGTMIDRSAATYKLDAAGKQVPVDRTLVEEALLEPDVTAIREYLLPQQLRMRVFRALVETAACEHAARMVAMKNASENAEEMIRDLTRTFHRARQAQITQEIAELMGGAEAIKEKGGY